LHASDGVDPGVVTARLVRSHPILKNPEPGPAQRRLYLRDLVEGEEGTMATSMGKPSLSLAAFQRQVEHTAGPPEQAGYLRQSTGQLIALQVEQ
jgi:hypothetical protein